MEGVTYGTSVHRSVVSWAIDWAVRNGCNAWPVQSAVTGGQVLHWQGCGERADVLLCQVTGGTNGWFKSLIDALADRLDPESRRTQPVGS